MTSYCRARRRLSFIFLVFFIGLPGSTFAQATSENVPGVLTPGGQMPQMRDRDLPREEPAVLSIPPVVERPLDIDEGPRIVVGAFDLSVDPTMNAIIPVELKSQVDKLIDSELAKQPEAGLTIVQIEGVAKGITDIYRAGGFALAWAYVPVQNVRDNRVRINVLAGWLESVAVEGGRRYRDSWVGAPFENLEGKPVRIEELESAILTVRDYPGLSPTAVLSPGNSVGASLLTLQLAERTFGGGIGVDNYGSNVTGRGRVRASFAWNNPLKRADVLLFDVLQTFDPTENTYGSVYYETPIATPAFSTSLGASSNAFDVPSSNDIGIEKLSGRSDIGSWTMNYKFVRSRSFNLTAFGDLSLKQATFDQPVAFNEADREDRLTVASLGVNLDMVDSLLGNTAINTLTLSGHVGFDDFLNSMDKNGDGRSTRRYGANGEFLAGGDFTKFVVEFRRLQRVSARNSLLLQGYYQWSNDPLVSLEQVPLGGAYSVRGYSQSTILVDKGGYAAADWIYDLSSLEGFALPGDWSIFLFVDFADGRLNDPTSFERSSERDRDPLFSGGGGLEAAFEAGSFGRVLLRVDIASALSGSAAVIDEDHDSVRGWGSVRWVF